MRLIGLNTYTEKSAKGVLQPKTKDFSEKYKEKTR